MASVTARTGKCSVKAYRGDAKTLLAFNVTKSGAKNLAGFTVQVEPQGRPSYYLLNNLQFKTPADHAQDATLPPYSTINGPLHKFRWVHVPGSANQGVKPFYGPYRYTVTPRYFVGKSMQPIDPSLSVAVAIDVLPFEKGKLALGFTRGFTQSQAFVRQFGLKTQIKPKGSTLLFDTSADSGVNAKGETFTFRDEYEWLGFTARRRVFDLLNDVLANPALRLDVFAYDLNEPDLAGILIALGRQGRVRIILDNAALHHDKTTSPKPKAEDQFETLFAQGAVAPAAIVRGKFGRYAHDKVFIVYDGGSAVKVLTGSTNFSVTGLYVNSNHVMVFDDPAVADRYAKVFDEAWTDRVAAPPFRTSDVATRAFVFGPPAVPDMDVNFSPHVAARSQALMDGIAARIAQEGKRKKSIGSVLFAVMQLDEGSSPVYTALRGLHANQSIFSYGISDSPGGIYLYRPQSKRGVLVTGKPINTILPRPFNQVPSVGIGHQVHHKFVVCGFNGPSPVVYCGSSNLAVQGETDNGDNLLAIRDEDVATVFAIEAIALVDHFDFLDRSSNPPKGKPPDTTTPQAVKTQAAVDAEWFLYANDTWTKAYFDPADLHSVDRRLFA
jgi:phosphatidylserine/phosphatidylglycerophosphate/cardiolipin synthase-like enzyme